MSTGILIENPAMRYEQFCSTEGFPLRAGVNSACVLLWQASYILPFISPEGEFVRTELRKSVLLFSAYEPQ
jgi:hypothetical protein